MSSPTTKRDQRRDTRKAQFQARQEERRRARERARRIQLTTRYSLIGGGVVVLVLLGLFVAHLATSGTTLVHLQPANGDPVDNIACLPSEGQVEHFHDQLYIYVNGQPVTVPQSVGIVTGQGCLYSLHTHDSTGIVHVESNLANQTFYLGNFFDIWGQGLSPHQIMNNLVDSSHKLTVIVYDANGNKSTYTGDPAKLQLSPHLTIYLMYNTFGVNTAPFTQWNGL